MKTYINLSSLKTLVFMYTFFVSTVIHAAATYTSGVSAAALASQLEGVGITITNPVITHGAGTQVGIYSNGISGAGLELDEGIILTGSTVEESFTTNNSWQRSLTPSGTYSDVDLVNIDPLAIYNPVIFEFDVTLDENTRLLLIDYQFASDEYHEYVGSRYNDAFGFFISGGDLPQTYNIARVVDNQTYVDINNINNYKPVTVNNVNNGTLGAYADGTATDLTNSAYFIDNNQNNDGGTSPIIVEYDGLTHTLHATLDNLTPGETYHFKMAIADTGDPYWDTGVFVNKINGLREPSICYDYSFRQDNLYLPSDYDSATGPLLNASVSSSDIEVAMYVKNTKESEIQASNITIDVYDINTSQAIYVPESVSVIETDEIYPTKINDADLNVSDSYVKDIPITSFDAYEYFYAYFSLEPQITSLDMPIIAKINYDLTVPLSATQTQTIARSSIIDEDIPICDSNGSSYDVSAGIFNVVHNDYYTYNPDTGTPGNTYYNLPTQVTSREGNFKVISLDPLDSPNYNTLKPVSTIVAVEMIDIGAFHDADAACSELKSSISDRIWIMIGDVNLDLNATSAQFNQTTLQAAIDTAVAENLQALSITNSADFYKNARENVAFRISYNAMDENSSVPYISKSHTGAEIINWSERWAGLDCVQDMDGNLNNDDTVANWCDMTNPHLTEGDFISCMECIHGFDTRFICSRDNFAIRPEALMIKLDDQNQTDPTSQLRIADDVSGVVTPSTTQTELAAGYQYNIEINATNHLNNNSSPGYYTNGTAQYLWNGYAGSDCNDTEDKNTSVVFSNGDADTNSSSDQIGEYTLQIEDSTWTKFDSDATYMAHHDGDATYFISSATPDCIANDSSTQVVNITPYVKNGCNISSNHDSSGSTLKYRNYDVEFHPYKFDMTPVVPSHGENNDSNFDANTFIYMSDMTQDEEMSFHLNGNINAVGYNSTTSLRNFTNGCYAKPINLSINKENISGAVAYQYRFKNLDINETVIYDDIDDLNDSVVITTVSDSNFTKPRLGSIKTELHLNFDRNLTIEMNPEELTFSTYDANCTTPADCEMNADLITNKRTEGYLDLNRTDILNNRITLKHYYGRTHASRQRYDTPTGIANIYYEVFCFGTINGNTCDQSLLQNPTGKLKRTDDIRWFMNENHVFPWDGDVGTVVEKDGLTNVTQTSIINTVPVQVELTYDNPATNPDSFPYKTTMENNASGWLIYNKDDPTATRNEFAVEFEAPGTGWSGEHETNTTTQDVGAVRTNRRSNW